MREAQAAFVDLARRLAGRLRAVFAGRGQAEDAPGSRRGFGPAIAHQDGVGQRLEEVERDRKQRHGESRRALCAPVGSFANHG